MMAHKQALTGRTWTIAEYQVRLGTGVNMTLDGVTATYLSLAGAAQKQHGSHLSVVRFITVP
jgi:hypothetical protein